MQLINDYSNHIHFHLTGFGNLIWNYDCSAVDALGDCGAQVLVGQSN